jgi:hypothetical protein
LPKYLKYCVVVTAAAAAEPPPATAKAAVPAVMAVPRSAFGLNPEPATA